MRLQNPKSCHKEDLLPALSLAVTEAAVLLVGSRVQFFRFINRRASVTPELYPSGKHPLTKPALRA